VRDCMTTGCELEDVVESETELSSKAVIERRTTLSPQVVSLVSLTPRLDSPCPTVPKDL